MAFRSLTENLDTTTPSGEFLFQVFGALAQYERALIQERVVAGLAAARKRGRIGGRPQAITGEEAGGHRRRARWRHVQGGGVPQLQRQAHYVDRDLGASWLGAVERQSR